MSLRVVEGTAPPADARALSIGPQALKTLAGASAASVVSTQRWRNPWISASFARSIHIEAGDGVICLVTPDIGDGALNIVVDDPAWFSRIDPGEPCILSDSDIRVGANRRLMLSGTGFWLPAPIVAGAGARAAADALLAKALTRARKDGAFRAALDPSYVADGPMQRALVLRTRDFRDWLQQARRGDSHAAPPLAGLIGLGSGLTPAGDDFVGGAMIVLRAFGEVRIADSLVRALDTLDPGATTVLSRAMLRAAGEGFGGATLHAILATIGGGDAARAIDLLDAIDRIGHTSGWDALAGALIALSRAP